MVCGEDLFFLFSEESKKFYLSGMPSIVGHASVLQFLTFQFGIDEGPSPGQAGIVICKKRKLQFFSLGCLALEGVKRPQEAACGCKVGNLDPLLQAGFDCLRRDLRVAIDKDAFYGG